MNSIAIFCGSSLGTDQIFADVAELTGETMVVVVQA